MQTNESNTSGIHPRGKTLLIRPEEVEAISSGGIIIPVQSQEKEEMAQMYATLIEVGSEAWNDESQPRAQVGERVIFAKYAGSLFRGNDGVRYRLIRDKELVATIDRIEKGLSHAQAA